MSAKEGKYIHDSLHSSLIKVDHIIFKHKAYRAILEENEEAASQFTDHHGCRMGKWYDGIGREMFGKTTAFKTLDAPHAKVHAKVLETLKCTKMKNCISRDNRDFIVNNMKEAEEASFVLFDLFKEMVKEGNPEVNIA
ncbi:CZB domain-containing protein [Sulfurimonas paralvinellae]|nr:CZB domain-containing protein [Sulfurimonas paralvinellae]